MPSHTPTTSKLVTIMQIDASRDPGNQRFITFCLAQLSNSQVIVRSRVFQSCQIPLFFFYKIAQQWGPLCLYIFKHVDILLHFANDRYFIEGGSHFNDKSCEHEGQVRFPHSDLFSICILSRKSIFLFFDISFPSCIVCFFLHFRCSIGQGVLISYAVTNTQACLTYRDRLCRDIFLGHGQLACAFSCCKLGRQYNRIVYTVTYGGSDA